METTDTFRAGVRATEPARHPATTPRRSRLVFVDHSYHAVTGSSGFFRALLGEAFDVVDLHCDDWRGGHRITTRDVDAQHADIAVFWQALPSPIDLFNLGTPAIWVPMYDNVARHPKAFWRVVAASTMRIISFCHALSRIAARHGIPFTEHRYYPDPSGLPRTEGSEGRLRFFLWDRGDVGIDQLRALVRPAEIERTILRLATDPDLRPTCPRADDVEAYRVQSIVGPLPRDEHLGLLAGSDVFFAPRRLEGIGLSVLEAMAMGLAVVAPDRPAMNEYIEHGVTGYLYDPNSPRPLDLRDAREVGSRARATVLAGHAAWSRSRRSVLDDVLAATTVASHPPLGIAAEARALAAVEIAKASIPSRPRSALRRAVRACRR